MPMPHGLYGFPGDAQGTRGFPIYSPKEQYHQGQVVRGSDGNLYQSAVEYPSTDPVSLVFTDWHLFPPPRRHFVYFFAPATTFSGSDDTSQVYELPYGTNNTSIIWVPSRMILYCSGVTSGPQTCSIQIKQNSASGNSGSPSNLTNSLSLTASAQASSITMVFPAGVSVPSGNFVYPNWTNNPNMSGVWGKLELQAQNSFV